MAIREYRFDNGPQSPNIPTVDTPSVDSDTINKGYADDTYAFKASWQDSKQTVASVKAIAAADRADNQIVYLDDLNAFFKFDSSSSLTGDDVYIITPTAGSGRWLRTDHAQRSSWLESKADPTAVKAISADVRVDKQAVFVKSLQAIFYFDSGSSATGDDLMVITPTSGTGRWLRVGAATSGGGYTWSEITGTSQTIVAGNAYIANHASTMIDFALPTTATVGTAFAIVGYGAGGWRISQGSGQSIIKDTFTSTTGVGGGIQSTQQNSCVELVCVVANTVFVVRNSQGNTQSLGAQFGYTLGGQNTVLTNTIYKLTFSTEAVTTVSNTLANNTKGGAGTNSALAGYLMGGENASAVTYATIHKLLYSTETTSTLAATLPNATENADSSGGSSTLKGYLFGGYDAVVGPNYVNTIKALTFSGETAATISTTMATATGYTACVYSSTKAYPAGGLNPSSVEQNRIEAFVFSGETISTLAATLSATGYGMAGVNSSTKGYLMGGDAPTSTVIDALTFSTETRATLSATLPAARALAAKMSGADKGYSAGGSGNGGSTAQTGIYSITYSGETTATVSATLPAAKMYVAGVQG